MDKLKSLLTPEAQAFIDEWRNPERDYITAHTSGSTGTPKQIFLPKALMRRSAMRSARHFSITASCRIHLPLSPDYIAGKMQIVRALISNATLTCEPPSQAPLASDKCPMPIQLLPVVGSQLHGLTENLRHGSLPEIRHLLVGGAPLNDSMKELALSGPWTPWESYGMTETASHIALRRITDSPHNPFVCLPGITVDTDSDGCLIINMGEDGIIRTNDVADLLSPTSFTIRGRKDNAIITAGKKVFPEDIEALLTPHLPRRPFCISSVCSSKWGEEIALVVEGPPCPLPDMRSLPLKHEQMPRHIIFIPSLPLTASGKIKRGEVRRLIS